MARKKRKRTVKSKVNFDPANDESLVWMNCDSCKVDGERVPENTEKVICSRCTNSNTLTLMTESELESLFCVEKTKKSTSSKPRGWRWMKEFVDAKGVVFHKGKEVPKLLGTRPITDIDAIRKRQKDNKEKRAVNDKSALLLMDKERKESAKAHKQQQDFLNHKNREE